MTGKEVLGLRSVRDFIEHFSITVNPLESPDQFILALNQLDPRYKEGRDLVQWQLEADQTRWPEEVVKIIMACAKDMRMLETETPLVGDFDIVIALGGARQSNLDRAFYAAKAQLAGDSKFRILVVAGSNRTLLDAEMENVQNYAPDARTEYDLCRAAAKAVLDKYNIPAGHFLADDARAGTPAIIERVLGQYDAIGVAAVTTQIYQLSTELDLRRVAALFRIIDTFVAGTPSAPATISARTTATYLSEVLRTLRAAILATQSGV